MADGPQPKKTEATEEQGEQRKTASEADRGGSERIERIDDDDMESAAAEQRPPSDS